MEIPKLEVFINANITDTDEDSNLRIERFAKINLHYVNLDKIKLIVIKYANLQRINYNLLFSVR